jgi:hypothetical protein
VRFQEGQPHPGGARRSRDDPMCVPKKIPGEASPAPRPLFDLPTAQVRLRGRTIIAPCYAPKKRGADGGSVNGRATDFLRSSSGCRRNVPPTPGDLGPRFDDIWTGSDALPSWYVVASWFPSRQGTGRTSPSPPIRRRHPAVGALATYCSRAVIARKQCNHFALLLFVARRKSKDDRSPTSAGWNLGVRRFRGTCSARIFD